MKPLIKIETIPMLIDIKTENAKIERKSQSIDLDISRVVRGLQMKSTPSKLNIDTFDARNSMTPTTRTSVTQLAQKGKQAALQATARIAMEGEMMLDLRPGVDALSRIAESKGMPETRQFGLGFIPEVGPEIKYQEGNLEVNYEMDRMTYDWKITDEQFEYVPGKVNIEVKQYADVIITYLGEPVYVPPSADPNYKEIDQKA